MLCPEHGYYKLIIMDNQMPVKTGMEVAYEIRAKQQAGLLPSYIKLALSSGENLNSLHRSEDSELYA